MPQPLPFLRYIYRRTRTENQPPRLPHSNPMKLDPAQRAEARQIATELARLARSANVLPGTITERHTRCGKPGCACHQDPTRLHGPYRHWTRKIANKTVGKYLNKNQ